LRLSGVLALLVRIGQRASASATPGALMLAHALQVPELNCTILLIAPSSCPLSATYRCPWRHFAQKTKVKQFGEIFYTFVLFC